MLLRYCLSDFEIVTVDLIIDGITFAVIFQNCHKFYYKTRKSVLLFSLSLCLELRTGENVLSKLLVDNKLWCCRSQWPCGLRRGYAPARLLGLRVRIPPVFGFLSLVSIVCVLSGRVLSAGLITRPEES
jgi:hypothetical protein